MDITELIEKNPISRLSNSYQNKLLEKIKLKFIDKEQGFNSTLLNKLQGIYEDLKWSFPSLNENVERFFSF